MYSITQPIARKADPSLKSFIFTLKNPHNFPARRFALKAERKDNAILCDSKRGPYFCDIAVFDNCNAKAVSDTSNFEQKLGFIASFDEATVVRGEADALE
jgi:hypothetical protein